MRLVVDAGSIVPLEPRKGSERHDNVCWVFYDDEVVNESQNDKYLLSQVPLLLEAPRFLPSTTPRRLKGPVDTFEFNIRATQIE